jgi:ATP-dependent Lon protease
MKVMSQQLDSIDVTATKAFEGYVVRKDLVRKFKGQYPVPTYVAEFLLGRYCASVDDEEISEGLKIVERQLGEKTIRAGEHELFKARAKDKGHVKLRRSAGNEDRRSWQVRLPEDTPRLARGGLPALRE